MAANPHKLTRQQMLAVFASGGSVMLPNGQHVLSEAQLPSEAEMAGDDEEAIRRAAETLHAEQDRLDREFEKLRRARSGVSKPVPPMATELEKDESGRFTFQEHRTPADDDKDRRIAELESKLAEANAKSEAKPPENPPPAAAFTATIEGEKKDDAPDEEAKAEEDKPPFEEKKDEPPKAGQNPPSRRPGHR